MKHQKMRNTLYEWNGGQDSAIYAAASSGLVADLAALQNEILDDIAWLLNLPNNAKHQKEKVSQEDRREAAYLQRMVDTLPFMLSKPFTHSFDKRVYRALPWADEGPEFVTVAVRRDRQDESPGLFFYTGHELTCYFHVGQHSLASVEYMQKDTKPADPSELDCAALIREWEGLGPVGVYARIVKRLSHV